MAYSIKKIVLCCFILSLAACSNNTMSGSSANIESKEKLYETTKNYSALISLYRETLKSNDNPLIRYKLANAYYNKGDSKSSLLYLMPLTNGNSELSEKAKVLQIKNLIQTHDYHKAIEVAEVLVKQHPNSGEGYNLLGIALAQTGNLDAARQNISKARELFINDVVAINNIAMLSIINGDYRNATELLLPQYLNGVKDQRLIHNLVFSLVKSGDVNYARDIIVKERLNTSADSLIKALQKAERTPSAVRR